MTERRYSDEEVRAIIGRAAESDGLTLAEIQSIAKEVGIDEDDVARAAAALRTPATPTRQTFRFNFMPTRVAHTAPLARAMTDAEWDQFVGILRETFAARGKVTATGTIREWSNGNLRVYVEPVSSGYRLRMSTRKGNAPVLNMLGVGGLVAGVTAAGIAAFSGLNADTMINGTIFFAMGIGAFASNLLRLPPWAARRREQMERVAEEAKQIVGEKP